MIRMGAKHLMVSESKALCGKLVTQGTGKDCGNCARVKASKDAWSGKPSELPIEVRDDVVKAIESVRDNMPAWLDGRPEIATDGLPAVERNSEGRIISAVIAVDGILPMARVAIAERLIDSNGDEYLIDDITREHVWFTAPDGQGVWTYAEFLTALESGRITRPAAPVICRMNTVPTVGQSPDMTHANPCTCKPMSVGRKAAKPTRCTLEGDGLSVRSALRMVHAIPCTCDIPTRDDDRVIAEQSARMSAEQDEMNGDDGYRESCICDDVMDGTHPSPVGEEVTCPADGNVFTRRAGTPTTPLKPVTFDDVKEANGWMSTDVDAVTATLPVGTQVNDGMWNCCQARPAVAVAFDGADGQQVWYEACRSCASTVPAERLASLPQVWTVEAIEARAAAEQPIREAYRSQSGRSQRPGNAPPLSKPIRTLMGRRSRRLARRTARNAAMAGGR